MAALAVLDTYLKPGELWVSYRGHSSRGSEMLWWGAGQQDWSRLGGCERRWVPLAQRTDAQV